MKKTVLFLFILPFCLRPDATAQGNKITDTQKILGLSRLWEGVRNNFVFYDRLTFDWDSLYAASLETILDLGDDYSYLRELERLCVMTGDGHTYVWHRQEHIPREMWVSPAPFTTRYVEGKVLVDKVWSSRLVEKGIGKGAEVTAVNGLDVIEYTHTVLAPYVPTSTLQWLYYRTLNDYQLTKGFRKDPITVTFRSGSGTTEMTFHRSDGWDLQENNDNGGKETFDYSVLDGNVGLLKIGHFMDDQFRAKFDALYPSILATDALVIDLRDNGGGNSSYADYVLKHLTDKPIRTGQWSSRMYIPAHASWGYDPEWYSYGPGQMYPVDGDRYLKPVAVLVNAGTFSSAEDFTVKFSGMERGPVIGTPTGGSTGNGVQVTLIEGMAWANICSKNDVAPDGTVFVGVGVIPDIEVGETVESFLAGTDNVLERALVELK